MKNNTRKILSYALTISMLFNTVTDNQNKKVDYAILPDEVTIETPLEIKDEKLKLNKNVKKNYTK